MRGFKGIFFLVIFISVASLVHAGAEGDCSLFHKGTVPFNRHLTAQEIQRVKAFKELLDGVDTKPLWKTIDELEKSPHPLVNLEMQEAMARAYTDIAGEFKVAGQKKKWLYSMVCLNMAYLQFGGSQGNYGSTTELNRLIRQKLKEYLPVNVFKQPGFIYSLE